jgi:hypothetical protein
MEPKAAGIYQAACCVGSSQLGSCPLQRNLLRMTVKRVGQPKERRLSHYDRVLDFRIHSGSISKTDPKQPEAQSSVVLYKLPALSMTKLA